MKIHDSHVRKYHRYMFNKTCGPKFNSVLFLLIIFCIFMGFILGLIYAIGVSDLFLNGRLP